MYLLIVPSFSQFSKSNPVDFKLYHNLERKSRMSHYLYDTFGNVLRGQKLKRVRKNPSYKSNGQLSNTYYTRDTEQYNLSVPRYIFATALHFCRHEGKLRHIPGRPPYGHETESETGFIQACIATTAYIACLTGQWPNHEREELTSDSSKFPLFRERALALLGYNALTRLEHLAATSSAATLSPALPGFLEPALSDSISDQEEYAKTLPNRPIRRYACTMPHHIMSRLTATYGARWGSHSQFIARVLHWFDRATQERQAEIDSHLAQNPQLPPLLPSNHSTPKIDYRAF